jgi:hypothetical protein
LVKTNNYRATGIVIPVVICPVELVSRSRPAVWITPFFPPPLDATEEFYGK